MAIRCRTLSGSVADRLRPATKGRFTVRLLPAPTVFPVQRTRSPPRELPDSAETKVVLAGTVSVMVTPVASAVPAFCTTIAGERVRRVGLIHIAGSSCYKCKTNRPA
jgi:hypothetical protein